MEANKTKRITIASVTHYAVAINYALSISHLAGNRWRFSWSFGRRETPSSDTSNNEDM